MGRRLKILVMQGSSAAFVLLERCWLATREADLPAHIAMVVPERKPSVSSGRRKKTAQCEGKNGNA
jgi:hypothetical protein